MISPAMKGSKLPAAFFPLLPPTVFCACATSVAYPCPVKAEQTNQNILVGKITFLDILYTFFEFILWSGSGREYFSSQPPGGVWLFFIA